MLYILAYDIDDDRRRARMHKLLYNHGQRVQRSVFECQLEPVELQRVLQRAEKLVVGQFDSLRIYTLCGDCANSVQVLGAGHPPDEEDVFIV